jgi:hypothetical protein
VVLDHTPSTGVSIPQHGTAKFLCVGLTGSAHCCIKIVWSRCQSNAGCYQGNDDGDVSYFEHHQLQSMSTAIIASVRAIAQAHTTFSSAAFGTVLFTDSGIEGQGGD